MLNNWLLKQKHSRKPCFVARAGIHGVNTPTMDDFKQRGAAADGSVGKRHCPLPGEQGEPGWASGPAAEAAGSVQMVWEADTHGLRLKLLCGCLALPPLPLSMWALSWPCLGHADSTPLASGETICPGPHWPPPRSLACTHAPILST